MIRRVSLAAVAVLFFVLVPRASADIELVVDPDLTAYLKNTAAAGIAFNSYLIQLQDGDVGQLDPAGWDSIHDRIPGRTVELVQQLGEGAVGFGELSPTSVQIAETTPTGDAILKAGAMFSLGKPFGDGDYWVNFFYKVGVTGEPSFAQPLYIPRVPEPSTLLLATLAGLGLVVMRLRGFVTRAAGP